jgi:predicted DsbA family dithiol-disulfide isomerase
VQVNWRSYQLRPAGSPPISPEYLKRIEETRPRMNQMARDLYGVEMNPGPFGMDSRPPLVAAKVAEALGKGEEYHARLMRAYWEEARDIEQRDALVALAVEVGLDADAFSAALDDPAYSAIVDAEIEQAARFGLNGVPAMIFADKYLVSGAQPPDALRQIVEKVQALEAGADGEGSAS